jgi:hypothetical protein
VQQVCEGFALGFLTVVLIPLLGTVWVRHPGGNLSWAEMEQGALGNRFSRLDDLAFLIEWDLERSATLEGPGGLFVANAFRSSFDP